MVTKKKKDFLYHISFYISSLLNHATLAATDMKKYLHQELSTSDREHSAWTFQRTWRKEKSLEFTHFKVVLIQTVPENKGNTSLSEEVEMTHWEQSWTCEASYVSAHGPGQKNHQEEEAL